MAKKSIEKKRNPKVKDLDKSLISPVVPSDKITIPVSKIVLIGIISLCCIYIYLWFNYNGVIGFINEYKKFPGFSDPAIQRGRTIVTDKLSTASRIVGANLGAKYVSPLQTRDICVKGEHQLPIAAATNDRYAYWCTIRTAQYYGYDEDACTIATKLYHADVSFQTTSDCTSTIPDLMKGYGTTYYFSSLNEPSPKPPYINVSLIIEPAETYQSTSGYAVASEVVDSDISCWDSRRVAYCNGINTRPDDQAIINTELANRQSVLIMYIYQATTYLK